VHQNATTGLLENHTIVPGTFFDGAWVATCVFDTHENRFVDKVVLHAGPKRVDLAELCDRVERLVRWYVSWFERTFSDEKRFGADMHFRFAIRPVSQTSGAGPTPA
jgi:hypothetical protein